MILTIAFLLILATLSVKIASRIGLPGFIIFLFIGIVFGSDVLNIVYFDNPIQAQQIAILALIVILFEGGFNTKHKSLRIAVGPAITLATIGVLITAVLLGIIIHLLLNISLPFALLIGTIVSSTDAAAVFNLLRNKSLDKKTSSTLEVESATNDPMAIILTVLLIDFIQGDLAGPTHILISLFWQIIGGIIVGYTIGKIAPLFINKLKFDTAGFYYVFVIGISLLSYGAADIIQSNGFIAVFITGYLIGNTEFIYKQGISYFIDGLAVFTQVMLFLMLGLLVFPSQALLYWKEGIVIALVLIFIARPIAVFLSTVFNRFSLKERLFLVWGGVKGAVPIVLATYPLVAGLEEGGYIFNIVFFVVLLSALIQGTTIDLVAAKLGILKGVKRHPSHILELISLEETKSEILEFIVDKKTNLIGKKIEDLTLPNQCLIIAIVRNKDIIPPRGDTIFKNNDLLFILVNHQLKDDLLEILNESQ